MSMQVIIRPSENDTQAFIELLVAGTTVQDIQHAIEYYGIKNGIVWDKAKEALAKVNTDKKPIANVLIAEVAPGVASLQFSDDSKPLTGHMLSALLTNLKAIGRALQSDNGDVEVENAIFVQENENFMTLDPACKIVNVFGNESFVGSPIKKLFTGRECVFTLEMGDYIQYCSHKAGYLIVDELGYLDVIEPFLVTPDKLEMYFYAMSLVYGKNALVNKFLRLSSNNSSAISCTNLPDINTIITQKKISKILIRRGVPAKFGKDARIEFLIRCVQSIEVDEDANVDFKTIPRFTEVDAGVALVERHLVVPSRPGLNVLGEVIPVSTPKDVVFSCGEGIFEEKKDGIVRYCAKEQGLLLLDSTSVKVLPELVIKGDVSSFTGNVKFSRNIFVEGNICSGYKVECGGNLEVKNVIEDGASVMCKGNLKVFKGLFGEGANVFVGGNAQIGFIQNSNIRVVHDLIIDEYIVQSSVAVGGMLRVDGKGLRHEDMGCVMGGITSSIGNMELESVGSYAAITHLYCGVDPELHQKLEELEKTEIALNKKVLQLNNTIGFDTTDKNFISMLKTCSDKRKEIIKEKLQVLKQTLDMEKKAKDQIAKLKEISLAKDLSKIKLTVKGQVTPQLIVGFSSLKKLVQEPIKKVRFTFYENQIILDNL